MHWCLGRRRIVRKSSCGEVTNVSRFPIQRLRTQIVQTVGRMLNVHPLLWNQFRRRESQSCPLPSITPTLSHALLALQARDLLLHPPKLGQCHA
jgi:hypothetical protein